MDTLYCLILEELLVQEWYNVIGTDSDRYSLLPPLRYQTEPTIYQFVEKKIPIVQHLGLKETWLKGLQATKFDGLAMIKFYASVGYGILLDEWGFAESNTLWRRYCSKRNRERTSFTLTRDLEPLEMDNARILKMESLRAEFSQLYKATQKVKLYSKELYQSQKSGAFYLFWKDKAKMETDAHCELLRQMARTSSHVVVHVLVNVTY
jgi:hypothetical protein